MGFGRMGARGGFGSAGALGGTGYNPVSALGSDLLGYWDANRADLITQSGNLVSSWKDATSNGRSVTAATTARPTYGATSFNGAPGLTFDGTANVLSLGSQPFPSGATPSEIWVVVQQDALVADATVRLVAAYGAGTSASRRGVGRTVSTLNRAILNSGDNSSAFNRIGTLIDLSTRHVIRVIFSGSAGDIWVDGLYEGTVAVTTNTGSVQFRIGASANTTISNFWNGQIAVVAVTNALGNCYTDAKTAAFHNYLMARRLVSPSVNAISAAGISPSQVALGWPPFGTGTTSYRVYRNGVLAGTVLTPADLGFGDTGLAASTTYTYRIAAITPSGTVWSVDTTATTLAAKPLLYAYTFEESATTGAADFPTWDKTLIGGQIVANTEWSRSGNKSVKFNLQYADLATNHHCQISHDYNAPLGTDIWYGFSWKLDPSYLVTDLFNDGILAQWHGATTGPAGGGPPPLAVYHDATTLGFYIHGDPSTAYVPGSGPPRVLIGSTWSIASEVAATQGVDYVMRVNYNYSGGLVQVWRKLATETTWTLIADYAGTTIYRMTDQTTEIGPFADWGPYEYNTYASADEFSQRIMWIDAIRFGSASAVLADVAPR